MSSWDDPKALCHRGAGFAGAATAYHLTQMGMNNVIVLEQEAVPGMHASGRNAAMVRQVISGEPASAMARGGAAFLRHLPDSWPIETCVPTNRVFPARRRERVRSSFKMMLSWLNVRALKWNGCRWIRLSRKCLSWKAPPQSVESGVPMMESLTSMLSSMGISEQPWPWGRRCGFPRK